MAKKKKSADDPIAALDQFPPVIEAMGYRAALINTTKKVKEEGERMSHCMGWAYMARIAKGEHIAYHIEGRGLPESGLTLGFNNVDGKISYDQLKGKKNDTHHCKSNEILTFVEYVDETITKINADTKEQPSCQDQNTQGSEPQMPNGAERGAQTMLERARQLRREWMQGGRRPMDTVRITATS